jgi:GH35 family endo-1,4-beta-xylanase
MTRIKSITIALAMFATMFAGSVHAQFAVINDNFEATYDGWTDTGGFTRITAVSGAGYNSGRAMMVTGRKAPEDGAVSAKGFYLEGGERYNYSVYVKHTGRSAETFNLTIRWLMPDGETYGSEVIATTSAQPNQWTQLSATHASPRTSVNQTFFITTNSTVDFYFDEFTATGRGAGLARAAAPMQYEKALKNVFANHFRVGNILNSGTVQNSAITAMVAREYNSITHENELKPDATMRQQGSTNTNIVAQLNTGASAVLDFCVRNNIPVRGHVLVWHGQTPRWFFTSDLSNPATPGNTASVNWATQAVMEQRLESYINNILALIKERYPALNLYAYDVVNEAVEVYDGVAMPRRGGYDMQGAGGLTGTVPGNSPWVHIYGDNSFIERAFVYAKAARDRLFPDMKLFYNDYNEWHDTKRNYIISQILIPLRDKGLLDGMGMQGHIDANTGGWSSIERCTTAMNMYAALNIEVQITELDIGLHNGDNPRFTLQQQANRYRGVFEHAIKVNSRGGGQFTAICIWGPNDANSWRNRREIVDDPTLHDSNNQPKLAYDALIALVPEAQWGDGDNPGGGNTCEGTPPTPTQGNLVADGIFPGSSLGSNWTLANVSDGAEASATVRCNKTTINITSVGDEPYQPQLIQQGIRLEQGKAYELTFKASAAANRTIVVQLERLGGEGVDWGHLYSGATTFNLTSSEATHTLKFDMTDPTDENVQLAFNFGGSTQNVTISDIVLLSTGTTSISGLQNARHGVPPLVTIRAKTLIINESPETNVQVRVINLTGKTVASFNAKGGANLSLKKIPAGMYIIEAKRVRDGVRMTSNVVLR